MNDSIRYIAPAFRDEPGAAEFAEFLDATLSPAPEDIEGYAWATSIPSRDQWESEASSLDKHLSGL